MTLQLDVVIYGDCIQETCITTVYKGDCVIQHLTKISHKLWPQEVINTK
jgi:hypothetical protein